ncbi:ornithine--oxo-acid transaminase [Bradyrhizobium sp. NFR13]|uniref:aminobacteriohopanetriol synthase HpnO n=1 Tax=Bradyrhizobium sp. NFR13 TaxID=1566285 RepID=UPI0008E7590B|nr:aminobacteriohopanetriol synthase HpnO [Bradyrhizobium sp. NFR13]SFL89775.1 ornithine--oxo-acid transaminase [Bradyrhizobium sp. NFR13]
MVYPNLDVSEMFVEREAQRSSMHTRHLNEQLVRVLKTIGYDVGFQRGTGQYLFDRDGARYLDLLSGFGVFAIGRNHPVMRNALKSVLDADMPNLVQMDVSTLAGILSEKLLENVPYMDKVFFANSGAETVEAAIKFARNATGRDGIVYCDHAYHGLTYGALSLTDDTNFRTGFGPLLSGCTTVPFNDLEALEKALSSKQVAGFIVEPIQGKGVNLPTDEFLSGAAALCRKYGTLFIADEIQTGLGRTGKFLAIEHWNVEPDMILLAKALSGGHVPVGALLTQKSIFDKIFNRMDRSLVHGSTFGKNDLAMAAGIATLEIMKHEKLVENAAKRGAELRLALQNMIPEFELLKEVRGKGLMIGVEFGPPKSLRLKASWNILESASKGLFCQLITVPLFKEQKILTQVSGHGSHTIKLLPPLVVTEDDGKWIENSFRTVIADSHKVPGAIWSLGKTLVDNAVRKSA